LKPLPCHQRWRLYVLHEAGLTYHQIAPIVGVHRDTVAKWVVYFSRNRPRPISEPFPFTDHRTLAEVWGVS
jgi:transposase